MSDLVVETVKIDEVNPHPNADRLELLTIKGWQVVGGRGLHEPGDVVIYVPPDCVVPDEVAKEWGVFDYLSKGRVKQIRLRGEPSFGFVAKTADKPGLDVAEKYGITKYEPPSRGGGESGIKDGRPGRARKDDRQDNEVAGFPKYTDIQNLRHHPNVFEEDETVFVQEKIHGTNCRVGLVNGVRMAGSRRLRRDDPNASWYDRLKSILMVFATKPWRQRWALTKRLLKRWWRESRGNRRLGYEGGLYWTPFKDSAVDALLRSPSFSSAKSVVLYGEIYGPSIQGGAMNYGLKDKETRFAIFDIKVDGKFLNPLAMTTMCMVHGAELCPVIGTMGFSMDAVKKKASGRSLVHNANHVREGVVVRPLRESISPKIGRRILKYVSDEYLLGDYEDYLEE